MPPVSAPFFWLVGGGAAVFALLGLVMLLTLRRSTEMLEKRWSQSFGGERPTEPAPTPVLVAVIGLALLVVGGAIALLAFGVGSGSIDVTGLGDTATAVIGAIVTFVGFIALLLRSRLSTLLRTTARSARVKNDDEIFTPGVTLAMAIVVTAIGVAVLLYGLFGN